MYARRPRSCLLALCAAFVIVGSAFGQSSSAIPPARTQSTTGTQLQDVTNAFDITVGARTFITDTTKIVAKDSIDAAGATTLNNFGKAFGYTSIAASGAAGLYRAGEQFAAGDCEGAGKTAARTATAAASDVAMMAICGALAPPLALVVGTGYAIARQSPMGTSVMNAIGDEVYYSAKGIFGDGPQPAPFDLDQPARSAPAGFRLNENPLTARAPGGYDGTSLRNSFQAAQQRNAYADQLRAQQEADARAQAAAAADAAAAAALQTQAMSDLLLQSTNLARSMSAPRASAVPPATPKSSDPARAACSAPKSYPTKDGCHPGHDEAAHPGGCHC